MPSEIKLLPLIRNKNFQNVIEWVMKESVEWSLILVIYKFVFSLESEKSTWSDFFEGE